MDGRVLRLLMERYFHLGFKNQVILDFLKNRHGIPIKRRLCYYGLKRRGAQNEDQELRENIWAWAALRVLSSVALAKIQASHL